MTQIPIKHLDFTLSELKTFLKVAGFNTSFRLVTHFPYKDSVAMHYHKQDWKDAKFKASRERVYKCLNYLIKKNIKIEFLNFEQSKRMLEDLDIYRDYREANQSSPN